MSKLGRSHLFLIFSRGGGAPILLFSCSYAALSLLQGFSTCPIPLGVLLSADPFSYFVFVFCIYFICICILLVLYVVFLIVSGFVRLLRIIAWSEPWPIWCMASFLASQSLQCSVHLTTRTKLDDSCSCRWPGFLILF